jgi:hypothetical protein
MKRNIIHARTTCEVPSKKLKKIKNSRVCTGERSKKCIYIIIINMRVLYFLFTLMIIPTSQWNTITEFL